MIRFARVLGALLVVAIAVPAIAQVTNEDIERARAEVNRISAESQQLGDAVQEAWARQAQLDQEISDLRRSIELAQIRLTETRERLEEVAVELYMGSTSGASLSVLFTANRNGHGAGPEYLKRVSGVDDEVLNSITVLQRGLDLQTERLAEASAEEEILASELEEMASALLGDLADAQARFDELVAQQQREEEERRRQEEEQRRRQEEEERRRQEEEARQATSTTAAQATTTTAAQATTATAPPSTSTTVGDDGSTTATTAPPAPSSGNGACPVAGAVSFTDTWGAPRSGGRTHQGVDMIAARGTPIVAIFEGTIRRISSGSSLAGNSVWLRANDGDQYFYAHLDGFGDISVGQRVSEGYVIGYNGSTGNAPSWLPHLHLEWHPGGGSAVNPYPLVKSICG